MSEIEIELPDGNILAFPDSMSQDAIESQVQRYWSQQSNSVNNHVDQQPTLAQQTETPAPRVEAMKDGYSVVSTDRGRFLVNPQGQWQPLNVDGEENGILNRALAANEDNPSRAVDLSKRAEKMEGWAAAGGFAGNALRGLPFVGSYVDEAAGKLHGLLGGDENQITQQARDLQEAYEIANPKTTIGANLLGAASTLPFAIANVPRVVGSGSAAAKIGRGIVGGGILGGAEGAVYGSGEGQEGSRLDNAEAGALWGSGLGSAIGGVIPAVGSIGRGLRSYFSGGKARQAARELGMNRDIAELLADRVSADAPYMGRNLRQSGKSATLGNLGVATRGLFDAVANAPGKSSVIARKGVEDIVADASSRFTKTLDDALGVPQGAKSLQKGVMDASREARSNAYSAAYKTPINYASEAGQRLQGLLSRVDKNVINSAEKLMKAEGVNSQQMKVIIDDAGNVMFEQMPDVRQIDYITRALKDSGSFGSGLGSDMSRVVKNLASEIRTSLDELVPEYKQARSIAADAISEREAVTLGRNMLKPSVTREDVALEIADMGQAEIAMVRQGLRSQIDDAMANVKRGLTRSDSDPQSILKPLRDLTAPATREKITSILGDDEASQLFSMLDETEQAFSMRVVTGSQTAPRLQNEQAMRELVPDSLSDNIIDKGAVGAITSLAGRAAQAGRKTPEQAMDEIRSTLAKTLTETGNVPNRANKLNDFAKLNDQLKIDKDATERAVQQTGASSFPLGLDVKRPEPNHRPAYIRRLQEAGYNRDEILRIMDQGQKAIEQAIKRAQ